MKNENNFDEFDNILFEYYKNNRNVPLSTQKAIQTAFTKERKKNTVTPITILKKVAILIVSISVVTASTVFAKDIINFINKIFNNSNPGVDTAVQNGYVQNVDMDFIECNNIGVKVDYVLMDDYNLDISFVYKYYDEKFAVNNINFSDITIKDENDNILYDMYTNSNIDTSTNILYNYSTLKEDAEQIDDFTIRNSLLVSSNKFPHSKILFINISGIDININNKINHIEGNWSFSINLGNKFIYRTTSQYNVTNNSYINNISTIVSDTSLAIELHLNTLLNNDFVLKRGNITLKDTNNNNYLYTQISSGNSLEESKTYSSIITLTYPITVYNNTDHLFLHIELDKDKFIDLELFKN